MDLADYRRALGAFPTGVTIVAAFDGNGAPWGLTASSFTSVSLEPPLVSVCLDRRGRAFTTLSSSESFAVSVLAAGQAALARHFAGRAPDRFDGTPWQAAEGSAPVLPDSAAWFDCRVHARVEAGDHQILLGWVVRYGHTHQASLACCRGALFATAEMRPEPSP